MLPRLKILVLIFSAAATLLSCDGGEGITNNKNATLSSLPDQKAQNNKGTSKISPHPVNYSETSTQSIENATQFLRLG